VKFKISYSLQYWGVQVR